MLTKLFIRYKVWRGKAYDIGKFTDFPADVLNNESNNAFLFDGVNCGSMESFLRSLMEADEGRQRHVCLMDGAAAYGLSTSGYDGRLWWKGREIDRDGAEFHDLIKKAYHAMFVQNPDFQSALMATRQRRLYYKPGKVTHPLTIITEEEFCSILTDLRAHAHDIISETLEKQGQFALDTAQNLTADIRNVAAELALPSTERRSGAVSAKADPALFSYGFRFFISIAPIDDGDDLWVLRAGTCDGAFHSGKALAFGSSDMIAKHISSKGFANAVSYAFIETYESSQYDYSS